MESVIALLVGMGVLVAGGSLVVWVLTVIAMWKIFSKAGEAGWKSLIPVYNGYVLYKIAWSGKVFWAVLILGFVSALVSGIGGDGALAGVIGFVFVILILVIQITFFHKLSQSFGHGAGFTVGLILLNTIFILILGLGSSVYLGPQNGNDNLYR